MSSERPAWLEKDSNLSLASEADVIQNGRLLIWTVHPTLSAYQTVFAGGVVTRAIKVSAAVVVAIPPILAVYPFLQRLLYARRPQRSHQRVRQILETVRNMAWVAYTA